jgi:murein DD-endopeptidase MepM/ murein hydrolase activator NlpD
MTRTKRIVVAASAGLLAASLGEAVAPAGAEQRTLNVTLLGGKAITVPLDVPAGTLLDKIQVPGIATPVISISPAGVPAPAANEPAAEPAATPAQATKGASKHRARHKAVVHELVEKVAERLAKAPVVHAVSRAPTPANPTFSLALPGPATVGVPNFFIDRFRIPPFLLPVYQAAGIQYGVRWEVLAAINEIETDYGRNLGVSSAGARGWMQFMPATWRRWGVDANRDGVKDPYNPVDAIFSAARYLQAAGAETDLRRAVFAYNHADWYVDSVLVRARVIGGLPADLVGSLTGLTQGRFPVRARSRYAAGHHGTLIYARPGSPVIAVSDGRIVQTGRRSVALRDAYGNTYTYSHMDKVARTSPTRRGKERLLAHPKRAPRAHIGSRAQTRGPARRVGGLLVKGSRVVAGTILGRTGRYLRFEIRPAGRGAPSIDPKPILDGWKLLESTAIYRAKGKNPLLAPDPTIGQILLMSKAQLAHRVLSDPRVDIYPCGRQDIRAGVIDRRVLATLEFLAASGLKPTVTALRCGHSYLTASGNVSEHSFGSAVDIAKINGIPIQGHQGSGSIADLTIERLLTLQGATKPHQIISLMTYQGADNTYAMADHADHIHVGFRPAVSDSVLKAGQWIKLIDRLNAIANPTVLARNAR